MALGASVTALKPCDPGLPRQALLEPIQTHLPLQVPADFECPIHLDIMTDPVTLSTGITYDRVSIERWLEMGHNTCPTTNQTLQSKKFIPNHILRSTIQKWCLANSTPGIDRLPAPRQPVELQTVQNILQIITECADAGHCDSESLEKLYAIAGECSRNRNCLKEAGAVPILSAALASSRTDLDSRKAAERALHVIALLKLDDDDKKSLVEWKPFSRLCTILASGSSSGKIMAANLIHILVGEDAWLKAIVGNYPGAIKGLVSVLREAGLRPKPTKIVLRCMLSLTSTKKNCIAAVDAGAVVALIELVPRTETRNLEYAFAILELLAKCAEGREGITNHPFAIPRIVSSLLGVSNQTSEHAVAALCEVISLASNRSVVNTALRAGAFTKLLMLLPSNCSQRAKVKARMTLKLLNDVSGTHSTGLDGESAVMV
ncbi:U-box domain-containing protein 26 [Physcomitrium patens]|uniref:RING-type E3 ubiquitin transferase n=1 Tax=Physcomitrium patens TaxID=3218 RepID=A9TBA4_PHYPA|nr:U-box domain-containing protein 26-like [Physcomitrium patens]PNR58278.1 hypothetical protein PHYPA_005273 [Physcomitrium patens]|eukprot:XP_024369442.1 U-box domain-containing protein 26-like [Physcomitrella patens]